MRRPIIVCLLAPLLAALLASGLCAEPPTKKRKPVKDMPTLLCERGALLFSDDFSGEKLSEEWKPALGQWEIADGALKGAELAKDNHGAVLRRPIEYTNLVAQFCVMFDGGKGTSFACNKQGIGHVCRAAINPAGFSVHKDRPNKDSDEEAKLLDSAKFEFKRGEWYTELVEMLDEEMVATVASADARQPSSARIRPSQPRRKPTSRCR